MQRKISLEAKIAPMAIRCAFTIRLLMLLAACASSSQILTGTPRAPIPPNEVRVYTSSPASFEKIAVLNASKQSVSSAGGERAIQNMIESLKAQAALLGANGLLLEDFSDAQALSLGTGVGSDTYTHNGSISLGLGGSLGIIKKTAKARAIFVAQ
jgi:uncharacterized lipoprotein YajG